MIGETVTLLRRTQGNRDSHGNATWTTVEVDVPGCAVWPTGSTEQIQGQDQTSTRVTVMFPYGTAITSTDQARVRGTVYDVEGIPSPWSSPFTQTRAGVEAKLVAVAG